MVEMHSIHSAQEKIKLVKATFSSVRQLKVRGNQKMWVIQRGVEWSSQTEVGREIKEGRKISVKNLGSS